MENKYAHALQIIGLIVIVLGVIAAFICGEELGGYRFNWGFFLLILFGAAISGVLFLGFAETINLLDSINKRLLEKPNSTPMVASPPISNSQPAMQAHVTAPVQAVHQEKQVSQNSWIDGDKVIFHIRPASEPIVCPKCGTSQRNNRNSCQGCGAPFVFLRDRYS